MSALRTLYNGLRARLPAVFRRREVSGRDEVGNTYYRWFERQTDGSDRERREVDLGGKEFEPDLIPPEWNQWLRRTRLEPPSEEDIAKGKAFRQQVQSRAAFHAAEDTRRAARARSSVEEEYDSTDFIHQLTAQSTDAPPKQ
ncbi:NUOFAF2 [Auxenochlorella protothecoides x Auxenochlorella symbiontica]